MVLSDRSCQFNYYKKQTGYLILNFVYKLNSSNKLSPVYKFFDLLTMYRCGKDLDKMVIIA